MIGLFLPGGGANVLALGGLDLLHFASSGVLLAVGRSAGKAAAARTGWRRPVVGSIPGVMTPGMFPTT